MFKRWRYMLLISVAVVVTLLISACGGTTTTDTTPTPSTGSTSTAGGPGTPGSYNCVSGSLTANGSSALQPLVQKVATAYQAKCSTAHITVGLGGSKAGLANAEAGTAGIGDSDVFASSAQSDLVDHQVAVVIFGMIVNAKLGVTNLTTDQIKSIYSGKATNWKEVGGPDMPIVVVSRPATSGTRATFQKYILGGPETVTGPSSLSSDNTGAVITSVSQTAGAIGYASTGPSKSNSGVTVISIDGNAASHDNVESNTYKFWNIEHMYTKGPATPLEQALIDYMASSDGQAAAASLDFILLSEMKADAIQAHQPKP